MKGRVSQVEGTVCTKAKRKHGVRKHEDLREGQRGWTLRVRGTVVSIESWAG